MTEYEGDNMDSLTRIARVRLHAKTAEKRLIDYILTDPKRVLSLNINELAEKAEVSYSTVCRLFPKAGYTGFKAFCKDLSEELSAVRTEVHGPAIEANLSAPEIMGTYCSVAEQLVESCRNNLDTDVLERAAGAILAAEHISFVGQGNSAVTARYAYTKLFRLGIPCSWEDDAVLGPMHARLMRPGHVLFAISSSGRTRNVLECVDLALGNGATVISLCDYKSSPLSRAASIPIYTTSRDIQQNLAEDFQLVIAHALVIDILYACCYTRIEPRARKYFDATRTVADRGKR